jgi:mannitol/fructose-specific phosphotransferase system IIA component (Ntr-type)
MLKDILTLDLVTTDLPGTDKASVIRSLLDLISKSGKVKNTELALAALLEHEMGMSTGMENGIAIPHAKTDAVEELVACIGITKKKIDFECLDRKPAQIFVMTLSPKEGVGPHIQFLAEISRLLKDPKFRKSLMKAKNDQQLLELITK